MGVAMLLIYWKAKFPKFLESENFQNFVRLILWTFVINISRYLGKFTKIENFKFLKIFIETCSALDCEIFQNFNFSLRFSKKSQLWPFYRLENLLRERPIPELSEKLSLKLWELIWRAVVKKTQNLEKCMSGNI